MGRKTRTATASAVTGSSVVPSLWHAAIYVRLSVLDNGKPDGESLESQIRFLEQYTEAHSELSLIELYQDNGFTGTNFSRPGWETLMADAYAGRINCIVVKDLSRVGRNYIEVGAFLERDCPRLGIRLISVNDGYDSTSQNAAEELSVALKNIFNDYYARDISRKVCTALSAKRQRGDFVGGYAPYGYQKDPRNKNHLIVDPEAAEVVRRLFRLRADGMGIGTLLRLLNNEDIPCPGRYRYEHGIFTNRNKNGPSMLWGRHMLKIILENPVYLGHLVQGKCRASLYEGITEHKADESEWDVVLNTHEAIIDEDLFRRVQAVATQRKTEYYENYDRYTALPKEENPYRKRLVCADCGRQLKLIRHFSRDGKQVYYSYECASYAEAGTQACSKKSIRSYMVDETVLAVMATQIKLFLDCDRTLAALTEKASSKNVLEAREAVNAAEKELERKVALAASCYTDWKEGLLTEQEYVIMREKYQADAEALRKQIDQRKASCMELTAETVERTRYWRELIRAHRSVKKVTPEFVDTFIREIRLHEDGSLRICFSFDADRETLRSELDAIETEAAS
jgi:DNA invertase Pin-like site-specific DNA recombinase